MQKMVFMLYCLLWIKIKISPKQTKNIGYLPRRHGRLHRRLGGLEKLKNKAEYMELGYDTKNYDFYSNWKIKKYT